jgi:hypothetical protein
MAAPIGNTNAVKGKMFYDRLRKVLTQEPQKLENIVKQLITQAEQGEAWAVKEVIDRLDGKAVQTTNGECGWNSALVWYSGHVCKTTRCLRNKT